MTVEYLSGNRIRGLNSEKSLLSNVVSGSVYISKDTNKSFVFEGVSSFDFSTSTAGGVSNQPTDATESGQYISGNTHYGKQVQSATFHMARVGNPSGTMVYKIRRADDNGVIATSVGIPAEYLSTAITAVTLNFNDEILPNMAIRVTVSGVTGSSGNVANLRGGGSDVVSGQSLTSWNGSAWTQYGNDCAGKLNFGWRQL